MCEHVGVAETTTVSVDFEEREGGIVRATLEVRHVTAMELSTEYKGVTEELWRRTSENLMRVSRVNFSPMQRMLSGSIEATGKFLSLGTVMPPAPKEPDESGLDVEAVAKALQETLIVGIVGMDVLGKEGGVWR